MENIDYKEKKVPRGPLPVTPRGQGDKQRAKEARTRKKKSFKRQAREKHENVNTEICPETVKCGPDQLTCMCYQCVENRREYMCDCCGKVDDTVQHVNSVFSTKGSMLCFTCYECERCPGCGCEAGGLCRYCRSDCW